MADQKQKAGESDKPDKSVQIQVTRDQLRMVVRATGVTPEEAIHRLQEATGHSVRVVEQVEPDEDEPTYLLCGNVKMIPTAVDDKCRDCGQAIVRDSRLPDYLVPICFACFDKRQLEEDKQATKPESGPTKPRFN